jgi:UDP-2-acetamido-3-amino-2,3-dideoxy-glucuronate N-acetyltransferase
MGGDGDAAPRIHPTALIEDGVTIGPRTCIWDHVHVRHGAAIGEECIIGEKTYIAYNVSIGNRVKINAFVYICAFVTIEDGVMISASTTFTNDRFPRATTSDLTTLRSSDPDESTRPTVVREGATVGAGCTIGCDLVIGRFAIVGMGSVVTHSVPDFHLALGSPARSVGCVCRCGHVLARFETDPPRRVTCSECSRCYEIADRNVTELTPAERERPLVTILTPAFNEADIVQANLQRIFEHMEALEARYRWEVVVVDDGSTDGTWDRVLLAAVGRPNVVVHRHPTNLGLGQALRSGFQRCRGDLIVVVDCDLTYGPEHIGLLLDRARETRAMIVVASPYMMGGRATNIPWLRRILSRWGNRFLALTARGLNPGGNLSTLTGMVRAYDGPFIRSLSLESTGMEINTEILYRGMLIDARIEEVPAHLDWSARKDDTSLRTSGRRIRRGIGFGLLAGLSFARLHASSFRRRRSD